MEKRDNCATLLVDVAPVIRSVYRAVFETWLVCMVIGRVLDRRIGEGGDERRGGGIARYDRRLGWRAWERIWMRISGGGGKRGEMFVVLYAKWGEEWSMALGG